MFNKVIIVGNITKDIELKTTQSGLSVTTFGIAVNDKQNGKEITNFFNVTCWRSTAEFVARWCKKGDPILVCGKLNNRSWTDNQGNKRTTTEITADEVSFVGRKEKSEEKNEAPSYGDTTGFEDLAPEDELPF